MFLNEAAYLQYAKDGETFTWGIILYVSGSKLENIWKNGHPGI